MDERILGWPQAEADRHGSKDKSEFVRIDFPAPTGIIRLTNRGGGFTGNIDGTVETWSEWGLHVGGMQQGLNTIFSVSWIELLNAGNTWTTRMLNERVEVRPVYIWQVRFNDDGTLKGKTRFYTGRLDKPAYQNKWVKIAIEALRSGQRRKFPGRTCTAGCQFILGDPRTCQAAIDPGDWCDGTRRMCKEDFANEHHYGGFDLFDDREVTWNVVSA